MKLIKFILALSLLTAPWRVWAVGVSVSPSSLDLLYPDQSQKKLIIKNISLEPIIVYVYPDDYKDNIIVSPQEINLLPEEFGQVSVDLDFGNKQTGVINTQISVVSKAVDKKSFNAASGLKIPLTININKEPWHWSAAAVFVFIFFGLMILIGLIQLFFWLKRPKKRPWYQPNFLVHHKKNRFFGK